MYFDSIFRLMDSCFVVDIQVPCFSMYFCTFLFFCFYLYLFTPCVIVIAMEMLFIILKKVSACYFFFNVILESVSSVGCDSFLS